MCVYLSSLNEFKYNVKILKKLACSASMLKYFDIRSIH